LAKYKIPIDRKTEKKLGNIVINNKATRTIEDGED